MTKEVSTQTFCDISPPLDLKTGQVEASRCYYCYDAPCIQACPTQIDIPSFIRKISNGNLRGAATDILSANIMGGTCARVCPVETLCEAACVREKSEKKPVEIGRLQRLATDEYFKTYQSFFKRAPANGIKVAVVGAGPAGLSCAHKLATLGYDITVYEQKSKPGGLNEYGLAPYKVVDDFVQKEIKFILSIGGIEVLYNQTLGKNITLDDLKKKYSAVFLGIGLGGVRSLDIPGENLSGVTDAVKQIEKIRQNEKDLKIGKNIIVIGGGNTAIDIAIEMKKLGAQTVTLVYRRGTEQMGATKHEQDLAQQNGVLIRNWAQPKKIIGDNNVSAVEFESTDMKSKGTLFTLNADQVFKAIGQTLRPEALMYGSKQLEIAGGKIAIKENFETTIPGIYAGGDCVAFGEDLTVTSVQHGKLAALSIHQSLHEKEKQHG